VTGPNARAAGATFDVRKAYPYSGYEDLDFEIPNGNQRSSESIPGDAHSRFILRLREISQSVEILKEAVDSIVPGEFLKHRVEAGFTLPQGEAYVRVESARGMLGCHVVSSGGQRPARVQFRVPSLASLSTLRHLLVGARVEDLPVILASLDLGIAEVDR